MPSPFTPVSAYAPIAEESLPKDFAPSPMARLRLSLALALTPIAREFEPEALALFPTAIANCLVALDSLPIATASAAEASAFHPNATERTIAFAPEPQAIANPSFLHIGSSIAKDGIE